MGHSVPFVRRLRQFLFPGPAGVFLFWITLLALVIRLVWNLGIHPPGQFITSDMHSYWAQSNAMLKAPWRIDGSTIFFPYGTAALLTLTRALFGEDNHVALAIVYALLGTALVPLVYSLAQRLTRAPRLARIAALVTCFYYPFISYGGYYLSELPFAVCVTASALFGLALADRGRMRDATAFGISMALGAIFRPQILALLPFLGGLWLARRTSWPKWRLGHWLTIAWPILFITLISAGRYHYHTGRWGLISGNSDLNYAFGRCHALTIESRAVGYFASFSPPPMGYLEWRQRHHPDSFVRLDPAFQEKLSLHGTMWSPSTFDSITKQCVAKTGYGRQIQHALVHVIMLWGFNNAWPDSGDDNYRLLMFVTLTVYNFIFMSATILMVIAAFWRRFSRHALLGLYLVALIVVAMVYFGDVRYRVPYDGLLIVLALDGWRHVAGWFASGRWHGWK